MDQQCVEEWRLKHLSQRLWSTRTQTLSSADCFSVSRTSLSPPASLSALMTLWSVISSCLRSTRPGWRRWSGARRWGWWWPGAPAMFWRWIRSIKVISWWHLIPWLWELTVWWPPHPSQCGAVVTMTTTQTSPVSWATLTVSSALVWWYLGVRHGCSWLVKLAALSTPWTGELVNWRLSTTVESWTLVMGGYCQCQDTSAQSWETLSLEWETSQSWSWGGQVWLELMVSVSSGTAESGWVIRI